MMALIFFAIHHFHIDHNAPPIPPPKKKMHKHCFQFLLGITINPERNRSQWSCKILGVNKVHYGLCENGEFTASVSMIPYSLRHHYAV